ncbi:MAG: CAP domain-containing protein [Chloroflexi bacterium]|nr:CAP domain-containing protein [Chloroflexota bacterium]
MTAPEEWDREVRDGNAAARTGGPTCNSADGRSPSRPLDEAEQQFLDLLNRFRQSAGLAPLQLSPTLTRAARWKAAEIASQGPSATAPLDHDDSFRTWEQRLLDCGYPASARFGEVLGSSSGTPDELLQAFLDSPVHREILSDQVWPYIGIGRALAGTVDGRPVYRWVVNVGTDPN